MNKNTSKLSGIFYYTDLTNPNGKIILLGVAAEVHQKDQSAFGLLVPNTLHQDELVLLDEMARNQLANPIEYLRQVVDSSIRTNPRDVLSSLANENEWALKITEPKIWEVPSDYVDADAQQQVFALLHNICIPEKILEIFSAKGRNDIHISESLSTLIEPILMVA